MASSLPCTSVAPVDTGTTPLLHRARTTSIRELSTAAPLLLEEEDKERQELIEDDKGDEQEEHHQPGEKLRTTAEAPPYGHGVAEDYWWRDVPVRLPGVSCGAVPTVVGCEATPTWWSSG
uniref:Uncharacterized protein n=1 Tax=Oryza rufipogon TaxID=4529 RepID=A0A0E0QX29_ORYRU